jgi:hypothetical protein
LLVNVSAEAQVESTKTPSPSKDYLLKKSPFGKELIEAYIPFIGTSVQSDNQRHLSYELRISNLYREAFKLQRIDICNTTNKGEVIASFDSNYFEENLQRPGTSASENSTIFQGGQFGILNLWLHLNEDEIPESFFHKMYFQLETRNGDTVEIAVEKALVDFPEPTSIILEPPFRSGNWFYYTPGHLNTHELTEGKLTNAQRFAIDWAYVEEDGGFVSGDRTVNENFPAYGQELLAVADGIVVDIQDGIPDNNGESEERAIELNRYNLSGNYIILDIGNNVHAVYAHLIPESFHVSIGDSVKTGDLLGLLGNSGESTGPHLHFHLETKSKILLGGQGVPYHFKSFENIARFDDLNALESFFLGTKLPISGPRTIRTNELPLGAGIIHF